jgi:hypothetical protein
MWLLVWKACLVGVLIAFAVMAVAVTVGGAADIRRLLERLKE